MISELNSKLKTKSTYNDYKENRERVVENNSGSIESTDYQPLRHLCSLELLNNESFMSENVDFND